MHTNTVQCKGCDKVLGRYPGLHGRLAAWVMSFRGLHQDGHIAWAGRGKADQELFYSRGTSRAHWGQSAHNYNAAVDWFRLLQTGADFSTLWYQDVLRPATEAEASWLGWYGKKGSKFLEYPHCEVLGWRNLVSAGQLRLVE